MSQNPTVPDTDWGQNLAFKMTTIGLDTYTDTVVPLSLSPLFLSFFLSFSLSLSLSLSLFMSQTHTHTPSFCLFLILLPREMMQESPPRSSTRSQSHIMRTVLKEQQRSSRRKSHHSRLIILPCSNTNEQGLTSVPKIHATNTTHLMHDPPLQHNQWGSFSRLPCQTHQQRHTTTYTSPQSRVVSVATKSTSWRLNLMCTWASYFYEWLLAAWKPARTCETHISSLVQEPSWNWGVALPSTKLHYTVCMCVLFNFLNLWKINSGATPLTAAS